MFPDADEKYVPEGLAYMTGSRIHCLGGRPAPLGQFLDSAETGLKLQSWP